MNHPVTHRLFSDNAIGAQSSSWWDMGCGVIELLIDGLEALSGLLEGGIDLLL